MHKYKFKTKKKAKFHFIDSGNEIINYDIIKEAHTEIFSNKKMIIEGCKKILDYQDNYIKLKLKKGVITLMGSRFIISDFEQEKIVIKGNIINIEFCV